MIFGELYIENPSLFQMVLAIYILIITITALVVLIFDGRRKDGLYGKRRHQRSD